MPDQQFSNIDLLTTLDDFLAGPLEFHAPPSPTEVSTPDQDPALSMTFSQYVANLEKKRKIEDMSLVSPREFDQMHPAVTQDGTKVPKATRYDYLAAYFAQNYEYASYYREQAETVQKKLNTTASALTEARKKLVDPDRIIKRIKMVSKELGLPYNGRGSAQDQMDDFFSGLLTRNPVEVADELAD